MTSTRSDATATLLTALVVLVFAAAHEAWDVWLVGDSVRGASAVILVLGAFSCAQGSPDARRGMSVFSLLGILALAFGVIALATASLTALSLLVACDVALWVLATARHGQSRGPGSPGRGGGGQRLWQTSSTLLPSGSRTNAP